MNEQAALKDLIRAHEMLRTRYIDALSKFPKPQPSIPIDSDARREWLCIEMILDSTRRGRCDSSGKSVGAQAEAEEWRALLHETLQDLNAHFIRRNRKKMLELFPLQVWFLKGLGPIDSQALRRDLDRHISVLSAVANHKEQPRAASSPIPEKPLGERLRNTRKLVADTQQQAADWISRISKVSGSTIARIERGKH